MSDYDDDDKGNLVPWKEIHQEGREQTIKWMVGTAKYEIYTFVLDTTNVGILLPHCLDVKYKIEQAVANPIHLGTSFFKAFPRSLSRTINATWNSLVNPARNAGNPAQAQNYAQDLNGFTQALRDF